jgi:hypothetical protein
VQRDAARHREDAERAALDDERVVLLPAPEEERGEVVGRLAARDDRLDLHVETPGERREQCAVALVDQLVARPKLGEQRCDRSAFVQVVVRSTSKTPSVSSSMPAAHRDNGPSLAMCSWETPAPRRTVRC